MNKRTMIRNRIPAYSVVIVNGVCFGHFKQGWCWTIDKDCYCKKYYKKLSGAYTEAMIMKHICY